MPLSDDPKRRQRQLANLQPRAAAKHHAYDAAALRPARERYQSELSARYPSAGEDEIAIQATRLAQCELLQRYLDERGVVRNRSRGDVFPAALLLAQITQAYERRRDVLAERERERSDDDSETLESIMAEYDQART